MTAAPPRVSIVIPVFNDPQRLGLCLDALERQSLPADAVQVIVVDNGSRPELHLPHRPFALTLLRCPEPGSYSARNLALGHCQASVVAFTDADCRPRPQWLEAGLAALQRQGVDLLAGAVILEPSNAEQPTAADLVEQTFAFRQECYVARGAYGATANLFVRREVLERLAGFDQRRKSGADRAFGQRARAAGFRIGYSAE
ncbi:MAG: glycosyltransferase, partial [Cyanobium sp.]